MIRIILFIVFFLLLFLFIGLMIWQCVAASGSDSTGNKVAAGALGTLAVAGDDAISILVP